MKNPLELDIDKTDALIVTDIQKDFLPGGALPVKDGDQIVPALNAYIKMFKKLGATVIASRDWHPKNHVSFADKGGPWPPHCVQDSDGAKFSPDLKLPSDTIVVSKATNPEKEAYSVFEETGLGEKIKSANVRRIFIGGLATDYCVVSSVLDARKMGFDVVVLSDATLGINVKTDDVERAFKTMSQSGAIQATMGDFPEQETSAEIGTPADVTADKPLDKHEVKKKARMRPKGSYKRVRREKG